MRLIRPAVAALAASALALTTAASADAASIPLRKVHLLAASQFPAHYGTWDGIRHGIGAPNFSEDDQDHQLCRTRPFALVATLTGDYTTESTSVPYPEAQEWVVKTKDEKKAASLAAKMRSNSTECATNGVRNAVFEQRKYGGLVVRGWYSTFTTAATTEKYAEFYAVGTDGRFVMQLHMTVPAASDDASFAEFATLAKTALAKIR